MNTNAHAAVILLPILGCVLLMAPELASPAGQPHMPVADPGRVQEHLVELAHFGANPEGGVSRVAFSDADVAGRAYVKGLMEAAGLEVRIDAAGNLIGRREGIDRKLPTIVVGSHTDSVPHGGNYDGDVGVMGGIEVAQHSSAPTPTSALSRASSVSTGGRQPLPAWRTTRALPRWTSATMHCLRHPSWCWQ